MPTSKKRPVTEDAALEAALAEAAPFYPSKIPAATLVRELAIKGAEAVVQENAVEEGRVEELIAFSTRRQGLIDWDVLERIDELAWGE